MVYDVPLAPQVITTNGSVFAAFGGINDGAAANERTGRVVRILGHRFRVLLNKNNTVPQAVVRIVVFRWNQALDASFSPNQVVNLALGGVVAPYNQSYRGQYKVLYDEVIDIRDVGNTRFDSTGSGVGQGYNNVQEFREFYIRDPHLESYFSINAFDRADKTNYVVIYSQTSSTAFLSDITSETMFEDV